MCHHCGCRGVEAIRELMDEHTALIDQVYVVRQALESGNPTDAVAGLVNLFSRLERHVQREEAGIFRALRSLGEFRDEVDDLVGEHGHLERAIAALDPGSPDFPAVVEHLLDDLALHIDREDYGIFPVSVVTLGAGGWAMVDRAHAASPSFLLDVSKQPQPPRKRRAHGEGILDRAGPPPRGEGVDVVERAERAHGVRRA
jgi:hemerythrin-like domain-containing protein